MKLYTVKQLSETYPAFSLGSLRGLLHKRKQNGLEPCLLKIGKKVLINGDLFEEWLKTKTIGQ